jgi:hypothetical protein
LWDKSYTESFPPVRDLIRALVKPTVNENHQEFHLPSNERLSNNKQRREETSSKKKDSSTMMRTDITDNPLKLTSSPSADDESKASNEAQTADMETARQGYLRVMVRIRPLLKREAKQAVAVIATSAKMLEVSSDFIFHSAYDIYSHDAFFHQYHRSRQQVAKTVMSSIASSPTRQVKKPSMLKYPSLLSQL